uniref:Alpha-2-macroglobulin RAP C-terminal domain-containing protein n=1 Tax=Parascaris univalens TaxID=6257 RepID=A0A915CG23_PARUN
SSSSHFYFFFHNSRRQNFSGVSDDSIISRIFKCLSCQFNP